jgi:hypothetical protein
MNIIKLSNLLPRPIMQTSSPHRNTPFQHLPRQLFTHSLDRTHTTIRQGKINRLAGQRRLIARDAWICGQRGPGRRDLLGARRGLRRTGDGRSTKRQGSRRDRPRRWRRILGILKTFRELQLDRRRSGCAERAREFCALVGWYLTTHL